MRTVSYKLADLSKVVIHLGKMAENDATRVRIDSAEVFRDYPAAQVALSVTNPVGETYPATVQRDGDFVVWDVKDSSLTAEGDGEIQISFSQSGAKIRSDIGRTKICRSIIGEGETPDPVQDWVDHANEVLEETGAALETLENMTASASSLPAGSNPTATYQNGNIAFGIPKGDKGDTGAAGQNGVTPNVTAGTTTTGAAGTSASVTRRAGSPDSAPIFDFTIPKGDKGDHGDLQLDSTLTSASAAAPADQVGNLKSALSNAIKYNDAENISNGGWKTFGLLPGSTSYNWTNTTALSPDAPITGAYKVCYFSAIVGTAGTLLVGLYTVSGTTGTITHLKEVTASDTGKNTFDVLFELDPEKTYYPFIVCGTGKLKFYSNTVESKYYSFPGSSISVGSTVTVSTTSSNGLSVVQCVALFAVDSADSGVITVAKKGGNYSTIQEAVLNATNGETILVYPGVYEEYVVCKRDVNDKTHIVGIDRDNCIIKWESGKYTESTISIYGNFVLENLTLIATHEEAGEWYPTWTDGTPSTYASYAVHVDGYTLDYAGDKGIIRNCRIYSECNHAVGAGSQIGYSVILENCDIERYVTDDRYLNSNYDGALGCHSPNTNTGDTGSHFIMRNCVVKNNNTKALQLVNVFSGSPFDAEIIGSTFVDGSGIDNVIKFSNTTNAMIKNTSHGNSTDEVNYRAIHT